MLFEGIVDFSIFLVGGIFLGVGVGIFFFGIIFFGGSGILKILRILVCIFFFLGSIIIWVL